MKYKTFMREQGLSPEWLETQALAFAKEIRQGIEQDFLSVGYLREKLDKMRIGVEELEALGA